MRKLFLASLLCGLCSGRAMAAVPNDFDGDGVSDLTRFEVGSGKQLTWKAVLSSTQETRDLGVLGKEGDQPAMGQWLGVGTQIGVISLDGSTVTWSILDAGGNRIDRVFGKKGDLAVAGGDFNGDGIADAAVVRLEDGKAKWQVAYNLFTAPSVQPVSFSFGSAGDRVFYARVEGGTLDWIGVMRKGAGKSSAARMKNLVSGDVRQFTRMPSLASSGTRPRAFSIPQAGGADLIGFQIPKGKNTEIRVFTLGGVEVGAALFDGTGDAVVGDFNSGAGYEVVFQCTADSGAFNATSGEVRGIGGVGGTLVDEISVATIGGVPAPSPNSGGGTGGESPSGGPVAKCSRVIPVPGTHIYKTVGSNHFTDIRRNTIGMILKPGASGPFPNCIQAIDRSGKVLANLGLYAKGAGWAARYYAGIGCGASTPLNGVAVAAKARASSGSNTIYMSFGGTCYGPIDATKCINSTSC